MPDAFDVVWSAGYVLVLLFIAWLMRSINSGFVKDYARQDAYFTPRMKVADQQFQALSKRLGAEYVRGITDWRSFATPGDLATTEVKQPNSVWSAGSSVRKVIDGYEIEVTYGVQSLVAPDGATGDIFLPKFTVKRSSSRRSSRPFNRFDAYFSSDSEGNGAAGRAFDKVLAGALYFVRRPSLPMPPEVERAHAVLTMNASSIWCGEDSIEATGRPRPRARGETREFGQGDFDVESMVMMITQMLALVRAMEKA